MVYKGDKEVGSSFLQEWRLLGAFSSTQSGVQWLLLLAVVVLASR